MEIINKLFNKDYNIRKKLLLERLLVTLDALTISKLENSKFDINLNEKLMNHVNFIAGIGNEISLGYLFSRSECK